MRGRPVAASGKRSGAFPVPPTTIRNGSFGDSFDFFTGIARACVRTYICVSAFAHVFIFVSQFVPLCVCVCVRERALACVRARLYVFISTRIGTRIPFCLFVCLAVDDLGKKTSWCFGRVCHMFFSVYLHHCLAFRGEFYS